MPRICPAKFVTYFHHGDRPSDSQHRNTSEQIITGLRGEPRVLLGTTASGLQVRIPLDLLTHFGITVGASGTGKSMAVCLPMLAMLQSRRPFQLIDAKSELFDRALYLLRHFPQLWNDVHIIDFNNREAISPYNILYPIGEFDYFITRRAETLTELLPGQDPLSLRGAGLF